MSFRHLRAVIRKEINHILRDRTTFVLVMLVPTAMLFIMAYALTVDIKHVPMCWIMTAVRPLVLSSSRSRREKTWICTPRWTPWMTLTICSRAVKSKLP